MLFFIFVPVSVLKYILEAQVVFTEAIKKMVVGLVPNKKFFEAA